MKTQEKTRITVQTTINAPIETVWKCWITPESIVKWNNASEEWHTPWAENDLRPGGNFNYRMEAKDGSMGFDFCGVYENVFVYKQIDYVIADGRKVKIVFSVMNNETTVIETFDAESIHPNDVQRSGWQAILNNFKKYAEKTYQHIIA
jgi:uncharacterized protein YndB with AHSA1/START domain